MAYDMAEENGGRGDDFMKQIEPIASVVPYMTCPGNHEHHYNFSNYKVWKEGNEICILNQKAMASPSIFSNIKFFPAWEQRHYLLPTQDPEGTIFNCTFGTT